MYSAVVVQEVLQRRQEPWRWGSQWLAIGSWQWPTESHHWSWFSYNYMRSCQRIQCQPFYGHSPTKQIGKVKNLGKWVPQIKNMVVLKYHLLFYATMNHPSIWLLCVAKSGFYMTTSKDQLSGWTEKKPQSTSQIQICSKKGHGHCLMGCCPSDPLQLSESQWNHYTWEVCSANQWHAPKTAMPAAGTGQQKGPNSSPWPHQTSCHRTSVSKDDWIRLLNFASSPFLTSHQLTTTSSSILTAFYRKNASTKSRRQKMLSKSLLNLEAWIFTRKE